MYHINNEGMPGPCTAQKGNCPYKQHFVSPDEAQFFMDEARHSFAVNNAAGMFASNNLTRIKLKKDNKAYLEALRYGLLPIKNPDRDFALPADYTLEAHFSRDDSLYIKEMYQLALTGQDKTPRFAELYNEVGPQKWNLGVELLNNSGDINNQKEDGLYLLLSSEIELRKVKEEEFIDFINDRNLKSSEGEVFPELFKRKYNGDIKNLAIEYECGKDNYVIRSRVINYEYDKNRRITTFFFSDGKYIQVNNRQKKDIKYLYA